MSYFEAENISKSIIRIKTAFEVCAYLVKGEKSAALLDTGMGCGDLKGFIESITDLPYIVILSHGHCDHAGGSAQFDEVYLSPLDFELEKTHCNLDFRIKEIKEGPFTLPDDWSPSKMIPQRTKSYKDLDESMSFDLGGITIQPILVPGHTQGMMVFLIPEEKVAIFGDACGEHTLLIFPESTSIVEYQISLNHLAEYNGLYSRILRNHGKYESNLILLENNTALCARILSGKDDRAPLEIHGVACFSGRDENKPVINPLDKVGNILYTLDKL